MLSGWARVVPVEEDGSFSPLVPPPKLDPMSLMVRVLASIKLELSLLCPASEAGMVPSSWLRTLSARRVTKERRVSQAVTKSL